MNIDEKIQQALNAPDDCGYARLAKDLARFLQESRTATVTPADGGWIPWSGGRCPVDDDTMVLVKFRRGTETSAPTGAYTWKWYRFSPEHDIVAYKVVT